MMQSLRILETAAGLALLFTPEKAREYFETLGIKVPTARELAGLRNLIG